KLTTWLRELGTATEGDTDEQTLRHLYHEMGHLFMRTYFVVNVEVPSWIEEGNAELFQYRVGNGTKPEAERLKRQGWLMEFVSEGTSIDWKDFINVRNIDNLDFTWKDPLRSHLQYIQAWSVLEFMISNEARATAYLNMLAAFKKRAEAERDRLAASGVSGPAMNKRLEPYLYGIQEEVFAKEYGNDLVKTESAWKDWVAKSYAKDVLKKPALRYHRGEWCLLRARFSKPDDRVARLARAEEIFRECLDKLPEAPEGYVGMGRLCLMRGQHDMAWTNFATALEKGANNEEAMLYGGIARVLRGEAAAAVAPLAKVALARPNGFEANYWYGVALTAGKGDTLRAAKSFAIAGGVERSRAGECSWREGVAHLVGGRARPARMALTRSMGQAGAPTETTTWLAFVQALEGERAEAIDTLNAAIAAAVAAATPPPAKKGSKEPPVEVVVAEPDPDATLLKKRLEESKPLPAIVFDERSQPHLSDAADYIPVPTLDKYGKPVPPPAPPKK
ncbi:MAG: hypothetical protein AAB263_12555, partial [Planctomycetota bacterium]